MTEQIESLKKVLNTLIENGRKETREREKELIQYFSQNRDELIRNLNLIDLFIVHRLQRILTEVFNDDLIATILVFYNFFETHLGHFINQAEGSCCMIDKVRYILRQFIKSRLENKTFWITKRKKDEFWKTDLWTEDESFKWEELIKALNSLLYGNPEPYMKIYLHFIKTTKQN